RGRVALREELLQKLRVVAVGEEAGLGAAAQAADDLLERFGEHGGAPVGGSNSVHSAQTAHHRHLLFLMAQRPERDPALATSQMSPVVSRLPETSVFPSAENATAVTGALCPSNIPRTLPDATSNSSTALPWPDSSTHASVLPSGEH